ncbi:MAG TPA: carotenoid oxygenase family protein [Chroococcidiopsis sp.]
MPSSASTAAPSFSLTDWQKGYRSLKGEFDYWIDDIEGEIPAALTGTVFRNGPGLLDIHGYPIQHPFDGDGMICAIAFQNGRAHFRNRFVRTAGFVAEQAAQKPVYRGVFGTQKPGGWLSNIFDTRLKNIANTHVVYWGKKLLALWEAAEPHRLDPQTLDTVGLDYLDGVLQPGDSFAAHPRLEPAAPENGHTARLVNFSVKPGLSTAITVYEFDPSGALLSTQTRSVPGFAFIHDFVITPNYAIFFQNPVSFNPLPYLLGLRGAGECISLRKNQPTQIIVIPRTGNAPAQCFPVEAGFVFHHVNAFERDGHLVIDSVSYADFPKLDPYQTYLEVEFTALPPGQLWRFQLNLSDRTVKRQMFDERCCEFPTVHPGHIGRPYRYAYLASGHAPTGNAPLQALSKVDLETGDRQQWSGAPQIFTGEPIFVPRSPDAYPDHLATVDYSGAEDDGWLISLVFNAERDCSDVLILDARDIAAGPVARLHLSHHVPYGLHGSYTPTTFLPVG